MSFDLVQSIVAYMRVNAALVAAFNDTPSNPAFWSNYNALQSSATDPIMPYLVFVEPNEVKTYETGGQPTYSVYVTVTAPGYTAYGANLTLTPGGTTTINLTNDATVSTPGNSSYSQIFVITGSSGPLAGATVIVFNQAGGSGLASSFTDATGTVSLLWGARSDAAFGTLMCDIYAPNEALVRQLGEQLCVVLNDCDESPIFPGGSLFYFRRQTQSMPPLPSTGPDASPTIFRRQIAFKYMYEESIF